MFYTSSSIIISGFVALYVQLSMYALSVLQPTLNSSALKWHGILINEWIYAIFKKKTILYQDV